MTVSPPGISRIWKQSPLISASEFSLRTMAGKGRKEHLKLYDSRQISTTIQGLSTVSQAVMEQYVAGVAYE
ncbi:MAG: hypothetical protein JJU24_06695 [Natronohydrobacter sp.]|nr:hypothetical protein [Natronohydrobacter sp.]